MQFQDIHEGSCFLILEELEDDDSDSDRCVISKALLHSLASFVGSNP